MNGALLQANEDKIQGNNLMIQHVSQPGRLIRSLAISVTVMACLAAAPQVGASPLLLPGPNAGAKADPSQLRQLLDSLSRGRQAVTALQRELVSRPAVGPEYGGEGEDAKARWIAAWLAERGVACERLDFSDERVPAKVRPNLVAVYPDNTSGQASGRTLWLLSHLDVAAPGPREQWQGDPFALRLDGDAMHGRGVEDNNQAIAVSLLLLESLAKSKIRPPLRLGLVMTSGALTDYRTGIGHVLAARPHLFGPNDLIVVMDYGNPEGSLVSVGEKGNIWLKVAVSGKSGHAGRPDQSANAFAAAAAMAHGLRGLERDFATENPLFSPPRVSITPTRAESSNTGINHIPGKFVFYIDARVTPEYTFEAVEKAVRGLADAVETSDGVSIAIERVEETPAAKITPSDAPVLSALDRAIRVQLGVEPQHVGTGSVTVAATLRAKGLNVVTWGVQETMHNRPEEYSLVSAHIKQAQVLARMLFDAQPVNAGQKDGGNAGSGAKEGK